MKRLLITVLIACMPLALPAVNWEGRGVTVVSETSDPASGTRRLFLKDRKGRPFEVNHSGKLSDSQSDEILSLTDSIYSWKKIIVRKIEYYSSPTVIHVIIHPEKIIGRDGDLRKNIPGGIALFKSDERFIYRFRIIEMDVSAMLEGDYTMEDSLLRRMGEVVDGISDGAINVEPLDRTVLSGGGSESAKADAQAEADSPGFSSQFTHWGSIRVGSGALVSAEYGIEWRSFELAPSVGYLYYKDDDVTRQALPLGLRLSWAPWSIWHVTPYIFAGGLYYYGLSEYESRTMAIGGLGVRVFRNYFFEGSYIYQKDGHGAALGFGARLDLSVLWR